MPRSTPAYPPEFKAEAVRLVGSSDRSLSRLAKDLGVADQTLRNWVRHAEIGDGVREALAPNEREGLRQLRREVRTLRQEREILQKAAACFARERDAIRSRPSRSSRRRRITPRWRPWAACWASPGAGTTPGGSVPPPLGPALTRNSRGASGRCMSRAVAPTARRASGPNCGTAAWCAPASASRACFAWLADEAVTGARVRRHLVARLARPPLLTSCSAVSPPPRPTADGSPTSPLSRPGRASAPWRWCPTPTAGASSAGRWPTTSAASWSSKPSTWRSGDADQWRASSITRTKGASTGAWLSDGGSAKLGS
jgi:transposase